MASKIMMLNKIAEDWAIIKLDGEQFQAVAQIGDESYIAAPSIDLEEAIENCLFKMMSQG